MQSSILIRVLSDPDDADAKITQIESDLRDVTSDVVSLERSRGLSVPGAKGDPISIGVLVLTMVGAGGFLTAAASSGGLFTSMADILNTYVNRGIEIEIETSSGDKISIKGSSKDIEAALRGYEWDQE